MQVTANGVPASGLDVGEWAASRRGDGQSAAAELVTLPSGSIALRNARDPGGPALIFTYAEVEAFIEGAKGGEFDHLID